MSDLIAGRVRIVRQNYGMGMQLAGLCTQEIPRLQRDRRVVITPGGWEVVNKGERIEDGAYVLELVHEAPERLHVFQQEFSLMLLRNLVVEGFEVLRFSCAEIGRTQEMTQQDWYEFARMMRNVLIHGRNFVFTPHDHMLLPVTWRSKSITKSMEGWIPDGTFFNWYEGQELINEMHEFAEQLP